MRRIFKRRPRLALGLHIALAMVAHGKAAAASGNLAANTPPSSDPLSETKPVREFLADHAEIALKSGHDALNSASSLWQSIVGLAKNEASPAAPLSYEEARLWLQSYNAGPYALLKYKGNVPYRETQNYVPRVMKYYQQDLSDTPYEPYIKEAAQKYGLDPQMIRAIMKTESDFRKTTISSAGARGLMQVMPCVWSEIRKRYDLEWNYGKCVFDPEKNIEVACAYLAWLRYDFLPRHFAEFELNPEAPVALVRDRAPVKSNRIETASVSTAPKLADAGMAKQVTTKKLKSGKTVVTVRGKSRTSRQVANAQSNGEAAIGG